MSCLTRGSSSLDIETREYVAGLNADDVASSRQFVNCLHTLNGLSLTYNPTGVVFHNNNSDYVDLLNLVWASYVLVVTAEILANPDKFTARYALMVLKNIHQSIVNFGGDTEILHSSKSIRRSYIDKKISCPEIASEIKDSFSLLLAFIDKKNCKNNNVSRKTIGSF